MDKRRKRYLRRKLLRSATREALVAGPCECGCGGNAVMVPPEDLLDFFERNRTPGDLAAMHDCQRAEARGDARAALDAHNRGLHVAGTPQEVMLETLAALGPSAPPWMLARWIVSQSYGWMLLNADPRTDTAARLTMVSCYTLPQDPDWRDIRALGTRIAACDWVAHQLATFDLGGLGDFLDVVADEQFKAMVPMIGEWVDAPLQPYQYESIGAGSVRIANVATGERLDVIDRGCLEGSSLGKFVLGRVVPTLPGGDSMFASRPLEVDEQTAHQVEELAVDAAFPPWLTAVGLAVREGRLPEGLGRRTANALYDSPVTFPLAS